MQAPYNIFIVGCAASGKTTLAKMICQTFKKYEFTTDLEALKEIFHINDLLVECIRSKKKPSEIEELFSGFSTSIYWKDVLEKRIQQLKLENINVNELETTRTKDGGYKIVNPNLWDDALVRTVSSCTPNKPYVFEFSRGADQSYLKEFNITPREVYYRSFSFICWSNPMITANNSLIVHVYASQNERGRRNSVRKSLGEHFVSKQAMDEIYSHDIFYFKKSKQFPFPTGFLSHELPIPVLSINNTLPNYRQNFYPVIEYLKKEVIK